MTAVRRRVGNPDVDVFNTEKLGSPFGENTVLLYLSFPYVPTISNAEERFGVLERETDTERERDRGRGQGLREREREGGERQGRRVVLRI